MSERILSERVLHRFFTGAIAAVTLLVAAPATASGCAALSATFEICPGETPWAAAEVQAFDDGALIDMGEYYVELSEDWAAQSAGGTLEAGLDSLLAEMVAMEIDEGMEPPEPLLRDAFDTGSLQVVREIQSIDMGDDVPMLMATMLAEAGSEAGSARLVVMFGRDDPVTLEELAESTRAFIALIRPAQEG